MKNTDKKIALFIDYNQARIIHYENGVASFSLVVESGKHANSRIEGEGSDQSRFGSDPYHGTNNEHTKNQQEINLKKAYFANIKPLLDGFDHIVLFGAGEAKKEFKNYLLDYSNFKNKSIAVENCDYLTDNQLLEWVRNYFNR